MLEEEARSSNGVALQPPTPGWAPLGCGITGGEVGPGEGDGEEGSACVLLSQEPHKLL